MGRDLIGMANQGQKQLSRAARLRSAKRWIARYRGKNLVRGYRKWFGVTEVCAVVELRMLGVDISDARLEQARRDEQSRATHRARQKERPKSATAFPDWDGEFAFIAGYTEGGAPYGMEHDDADADEVLMWRRTAQNAGIPATPRSDDDDDLPF